jgi:hypothetical protein
VPLRKGRTEFFTEDGEVHPIRDSPGYSRDVEHAQQEARHHREREHFYRGVKRERSTVQRPEWARGMSDAQVVRIAREHDRSAYAEHWWHGVNLQRGSAEYRYMRQGAGRGEHGTRGLRKGGRAPKQSRAEASRVARESARGADLPF